MTVRNTEVVDWTNLPSFRDVIAKRRNSLFSHVVRLDDHMREGLTLSQQLHTTRLTVVVLAVVTAC